MHHSQSFSGYCSYYELCLAKQLSAHEISEQKAEDWPSEQEDTLDDENQGD